MCTFIYTYIYISCWNTVSNLISNQQGSHRLLGLEQPRMVGKCSSWHVFYGSRWCTLSDPCMACMVFIYYSHCEVGMTISKYADYCSDLTSGMVTCWDVVSKIHMYIWKVPVILDKYVLQYYIDLYIYIIFIYIYTYLCMQRYWW